MLIGGCSFRDVIHLALKAIFQPGGKVFKARVFKSAEASGFEVVFVKIEGLVYFIA
jgi:hypothetical protein